VTTPNHCQHCLLWKRRYLHTGTCWQHHVTTEQDETCESFTPKVIHVPMPEARA
jgi:hypothetical protein